MRKFANLDLGLSIEADTVESFLSALKPLGLAKMPGKNQVKELLEGKRDEAGGFSLVEETASELVTEPVVEEKLAGDAAFSDGEVEKAVKEALDAGVPVVTEKPADPAPAPAAPKVKAVVKAAAPKGKIKPVRKDTKIARGLEALLGGVTMDTLLAVNVGDDPVDFVNRRVTKRGYGVALLEGGVMKLVLPEGVTAVAYSG